MLDLGNYLLGAAYLVALSTFGLLGAAQIRKRLLPGRSGPPAWLATTVLFLSLLLVAAELLGTFGVFEAWLYLGAVAVGGLALRLGVGGDASPAGGMGRGGPRTPSPAEPPSPHDRTRGPEGPHPLTGPAGRGVFTLIALLIAAAAVIHFADGVRLRLDTGMTGFDSTWYHGPFAAGFFQTGNTWDLHFIAPQFLAWFYPANSEVFHAIGMLAFDRDVLSPLLNLGWFLGCLLACWCIGRPFGVAPFSPALGAIALSVPAFADQAGEARNDIVGCFFLLAAVAIALDGWRGEERRLPTGALIVTGLAAGLAAGTKLNFLLPAVVLIGGLVVIAPRGARSRALAAAGLPALATGGYWYLRNLIHTGNPLPWIDSIGPIPLPAPEQELGGRGPHSVLGYMTDGTVWADWLLPGLRDGLSVFWPLLAPAALAGLVLCLTPSLRWSLTAYKGVKEQRKPGFGVLGVAGATGLAIVVAWLIAPTSASGPAGMPIGFESGLRYLIPALVLGLALLPTTPLVSRRLANECSVYPDICGKRSTRSLRRFGFAAAAGLVLAAIAIGYCVQRDYLRDRYANPTFTNPGLNAAFKWSHSISDAKIATTSTRQYPLFGTDLSNDIRYIGIEQPHGGFVPPATCRQWRRLLNEGDYDYVIATLDRTAAGKEQYPPSATWTTDPNTTLVLSKLPTKVYRLRGPLDPSSCGDL